MTKPTRMPLPLILIRGFGGLSVEDEKHTAYQGFNDGTVYPQKRGENYIYEGFVLRLLKSSWQYQDATNVIGYYDKDIETMKHDYPELEDLPKSLFTGGKLVVDPAMALHLLRNVKEPRKTLWVFRYYDLNDRRMVEYGKALVRLVEFIQALAYRNDPSITTPRVNIIAHSMGGLLVREAVQRTYPESGKKAEDYINKIVTLGTPHQGISFQVLERWAGIKARDEIRHFNPDFQRNETNPVAFVNFRKHFPLDRLLTVVGTNYKAYDVGISRLGNRLAGIEGEYGMNYNRSDGLVKQSCAQIPGAPRTFVHKCHGGRDSLVTARESFEIATRFFFGNIKVRLLMVQGEVLRGKDMFGKSEYFFGVSIKPRSVDFELFHQGADSENCYGPFEKKDLSDPDPQFAWAGPGRLIWEGYLDTAPILEDESIIKKDMVMRIDFYLGERDLYGLGFSDNVIFRQQCYVRCLLQDPFSVFLHKDESFASVGYVDEVETEMTRVGQGWEFEVSDVGFKGRFRIEWDEISM